ncbi:hypothetical protein N656DRAFT_777198 [Canariomyces notabilis]|uniref:Uncharacterized protein n=1 Tax=Canariomyces notabilis TaxID=2074819 RepID=A0AAN6YU29_9PEZI|nr:hypothetical protein N656DRAFT_777198 [Canariomyces arenarius]
MHNRCQIPGAAVITPGHFAAVSCQIAYVTQSAKANSDVLFSHTASLIPSVPSCCAPLSSAGLLHRVPGVAC